MAISRTRIQKQLAGAIIVWTTTSAPTGWLLCDGSAVSRTTYADLFAKVGTSFGVGDGSTTFNVPDLRDRTVVGISPTIGLAQTSKGETIQPSASVSSNQSASHTHTGNTGNDSAAHTHSYSKSGGSANTSDNINTNHTHSITTGNQESGHTHSLNAHTHATPDLVVNFIIKT